MSPWLVQVSEPSIRASIAQLEGFHNRYFASATGAEAAAWIRDQWLTLAAGRDDVDAVLFTDCNDCGGQPSVILTIEGNALADENVVLGAHLDSVNWASGDPSTARAPGADDDASGVATLTEILRVAMATGYRPARTVRFMAYAAEEVGLNGSQAIAASFADAGVTVVGALVRPELLAGPIMHHMQRLAPGDRYICGVGDALVDRLDDEVLRHRRESHVERVTHRIEL